MIQVVYSQDFEELANTWMVGRVQRLREILKDSGVNDESIQREICTNFFFDLAIDFDDAEIPQPAVPRRRLGFEDHERLTLPDDNTYSMHETAIGIVDVAFDGE